MIWKQSEKKSMSLVKTVHTSGSCNYKKRIKRKVNAKIPYCSTTVGAGKFLAFANETKDSKPWSAK